MTKRTTSLTIKSSKVSPIVMEMIAEFFKMLSEVSRLEIVCSLKTGPLTVSQIIEATGLGQANVSKHLKLLTNARILSRQQQGVNVVYEISNPIIFPLCDLVCNSLVNQIHYQNQALEKFRAFQI